MLKFTESQQELCDIALEPIKRGFEVDIIEVQEFGIGVTTALKHISKKCNEGKNLNVWITATRPWDALMTLCKVTEKLTGQHNHGCGHLDTIWRNFKALSGDGKRPLVIWLDEARIMKPVDRETLICQMEYVATHNDLDVRCVFILGRTLKYNVQTHKKELVFPHSDRLYKRARHFEFTKHELEQQELPRQRATA
jgi:hypothetical protein